MTKYEATTLEIIYDWNSRGYDRRNDRLQSQLDMLIIRQPSRDQYQK